MAMMNDRFDPLEEFPMVKVKELVFEKVRLSTNRIIKISALEIMNNSKFSLHEDMVAQYGHQMVLSLTTDLATGKLQNVDSREFLSHNSIWQMFKEKYMPKWFVRRYPIKKQKELIAVTTSFYFMCPHMDATSNEPHLKFMSVGRDWLK